MTIEQEKTAAMRYVRAALKRGHAISVHEGGGYAIRHATKAQEVADALQLTAADTVEIYEPQFGGKRLGWLFFVWGNSPEEVLNDYSDNELTNEIVNEAEGKTN